MVDDFENIKKWNLDPVLLCACLSLCICLKWLHLTPLVEMGYTMALKSGKLSKVWKARICFFYLCSSLQCLYTPLHLTWRTHRADFIISMIYIRGSYKRGYFHSSISLHCHFHYLCIFPCSHLALISVRHSHTRLTFRIKLHHHRPPTRPIFCCTIPLVTLGDDRRNATVTQTGLDSAVGFV